MRLQQLLMTMRLQQLLKKMRPKQMLPRQLKPLIKLLKKRQNRQQHLKSKIKLLKEVLTTKPLQPKTLLPEVRLRIRVFLLKKMNQKMQETFIHSFTLA